MAKDWPTWREMNWLRLNEGPHDGRELPIAPTMKTIIYCGKTYHRIQDGRARQKRPSRRRTGYGGSYLWDGWWPQMVAQAERERAAAESET
jgi:hypothetical protein